jgi:RimJ/RimL family protein N-acetyltransferase
VDASRYHAVEALRDGARLEIRSLRPEDAGAMLAAAARSSSESLTRRFFAPRRAFSGKEIAFFTQPDFERHVALVAVVGHVVGGARYVAAQGGGAEVAFGIEDRHQRRGIAPALLRHLVLIARCAGIEAFHAEVLPENAPMLAVFERSGLALTRRREQGVVHVEMRL